ncbi:hypothetical protein DWY69_06020 [Eisenbergiella massiliensis]|uniref:Histidine phosphatase family protein n=1 Tax=Eisenbergiella massiliensis TaxID=1720294 RepID=A0A3E3IE03_9FIRM|nr:hypothetical protein DXC51_02220 [Eisenbergiella massiliensis]RGE73208.1 hypothetical protein DWY69_06020 [Eisenbergiella massiliensis]
MISENSNAGSNILEIYLIRHGETDWNFHGKWPGREHV